MFQAGDIVRELHGTGSGTVTRILPGNRVAVLMDGWEMDYALAELVLVNRVAPNKATELPSAPESLGLSEGLCLGFSQAPNSEHCDLFVFNNTANSVFIHLLIQPGKPDGRSVFRDLIKPAEKKRIHNFLPPVQGTGEAWCFQVVVLSNGKEEAIPPFQITKRFRPKDYNKYNLPGGEVLWYAMLEPPVIAPVSEQPPQELVTLRPSQVVDLHHDQIIDAATLAIMREEDILRQQVEHFKQQLDRAVVAGMDQITFIHGIGNGTLQQRILDFIHENPYQPTSLTAQPANERIYGQGAVVILIG